MGNCTASAPAPPNAGRAAGASGGGRAPQSAAPAPKLKPVAQEDLAAFTATAGDTFLRRNKVQGVLGKGAFGVVLLVTSQEGPAPAERAAKLIKKPTQARSRQVAEQQCKAEVVACEKAGQHPNLMQLVEHYDSPVSGVMVYQYLAGGELLYNLRGRQQYTRHTVQIVLLGIIRGVARLHDVRIAHLDIKPQNTMLARRLPPGAPLRVGDVKVVDFGSCAEFQVGRRTLCAPAGSPHFAAPEVVALVRNKAPKGMALGPFNEKADVWSVGVVAYALLTGKHPFAADMATPEKMKMDAFYARVCDGDGPMFAKEYVAGVPDDAVSLLRACLAHDARARPTCDELLSGPFLDAVAEEEEVEAAATGLDASHIWVEGEQGKRNLRHCWHFHAVGEAVQAAVRMLKLCDFMAARGDVQGVISPKTEKNDGPRSQQLFELSPKGSRLLLLTRPRKDGGTVLKEWSMAKVGEQQQVLQSGVGKIRPPAAEPAAAGEVLSGGSVSPPSIGNTDSFTERKN